MRLSKEKNNIVYSDNGQDRAIIGTISKEDDYFITVVFDDGQEMRIGKRVIVKIKPVEGQQ